MIEELRPYLAKPADVVDPDLEGWAARARLEGKKYADYGEALFIPGVGRIIRPWEGAPYSPSQLAKAYMKSQPWSFQLRRNESWGEIPKPVMYFGGKVEGDWSYLDLAHAYWQIGQFFPWFVSKPGERKARAGCWWRPELVDPYRRVRLTLFGLLAYPGGTTVWRKPDGSTILSQCPPERAKYANIPWGTAILWVVHALATDFIREFNGPLWHTDGGLVPRDLELQAEEWLWRRWKIIAAVKERGSGAVLAPGNYEWRPTFRPSHPCDPVSTLLDLDVEVIRRWWLIYRG